MTKPPTGDIATNENTADALLNDELDKAMKKFKAKEPAFFNEYTSARMIVDLDGRSQSRRRPCTSRANAAESVAGLYERFGLTTNRARSRSSATQRPWTCSSFPDSLAAGESGVEKRPIARN